MALEHALLVSLTERPGSASSCRAASTARSGSSGGPRTSRSTGCSPGWRPTAGYGRAVAQSGKPDKKVYAVAPARREGPRGVDRRARTRRAGAQRPRRQACAARRTATARPCWTAYASTSPSTRPASAHYRTWSDRDYPEPAGLTGPDLDQYLVLRGGIRLEEFWVGWLTEYLTAHETAPATEEPR